MTYKIPLILALSAYNSETSRMNALFIIELQSAWSYATFCKVFSNSVKGAQRVIDLVFEL